MTIFLETERLILKPTRLSDFDDIFSLRSDSNVMKYVGDGSIQAEVMVKDFINMTIKYQEKQAIGFCSVFEKESGDFVGQAGLFHLGYDENQPDIEIAYRLHKRFWGKGYATELAKALIHWGFQHLSVDKLIATTAPGNVASQKVLQKAGLDFRGKKKWRDGREIYWYEIYKSDSIELVPYDNQWPKRAELEIEKLRETLPSKHILDIQHVGSTAIPGVHAKPIIDIQIAVDSLVAIKQTAIDSLKTLGYEYWSENPDPERMFFVKGMPPFGDKRTHHVHIVEPASKHWQGKIQFRDYLLSHPEAALKYEKLKMLLASQHTYDREKYTDMKSQFVSEILQKVSNDTTSQKPLPFVIFLTGASGAGKTTLINILSNENSDSLTAYLHFDDIGVPNENEMIKTYGSGSEWQKGMTYHWIQNIIRDCRHKKLVMLEGQVNLDFIVNAFSGFDFKQYKIILVHCDKATRHQRLHLDRNQPELVNDNMDAWADFLKKQAINRSAIILDTTEMTTDEMVCQFKQLIDSESLL